MPTVDRRFLADDLQGGALALVDGDNSESSKVLLVYQYFKLPMILSNFIREQNTTKNFLRTASLERVDYLLTRLIV